MGIIAGLVSMSTWGTADFLAAIGSRKMGNYLALFGMQVIGLFLFSIYFVVNLQTFELNKIPQYIPILFFVAIFQLLAYIFFYSGLAKGQVSLVSPVGASYGIITALLSVIFYKEVLKFNQIIAIILIVVSIFLISINLDQFIKLKKFSLLIGIKEGLIAMFGWGVSLFLIVIPSKGLGWFLPVLIFKSMLLIILTIYLLLTKQLVHINKIKNNILLLIFVGGLDMMAFFSYSFGVNGTNASIVAPVSSAFTMITILLGLLILKKNLYLIRNWEY